ncbi:MAG: HD-GYP domain-containing protein [Cyanobium sp.]
MTTLQLVAELAPAAACMRDAATGSHLELVNRITRLIATGVAPHDGLNDRFVEQVSTFARLLKPGRLDAAEMAVMRTHVEKGLVILERLDSTGYPAGLRGEAIPLEGRIVAEFRDRP